MPDDTTVAVRSLKLLTVNTHKGFNAFNRRFVLDDLRSAVREESADLVFMQEVQGKHSRFAALAEWKDVPHYEYLADSIWTEYAYGRNAVYEEGHHGNALLSKFPIVSHENHDVSIGHIEQRGLLHCVVRIPDASVQLHAICVHLGLMEAHRQEQLSRLCALIEERIPPEAPVLVAGDFNDWRSRAHRRLRDSAGLKEAFVELHGRSPRTFPARLPLLPLDRIYYRNVRVLNSRRLSARQWSRLSDHVALCAEVAL